MNQIINGDCKEVLKTFVDNTFDSIVTDPPAGIGFMGKEWDTFNQVKSGFKGQSPANENATNSFFKTKGQTIKESSKARDNFIRFITEVFTEGLRVLKPGGHALVWALPRTSHWTGMALESAGFEVRDCVYHLFGSGFPKSLNIGKAIDNLQGNKREVIRKIEQPGSTNKRLSMGDGWQEEPDLTKGNTEWEGWGTSLKPAVECWWLCRKPLEENTVAENVLIWGTGGLNIDGSRVGIEVIKNAPPSYQGKTGEFVNQNKNFIKGKIEYNIGRFPSHLIHDGSDVVLAELGNESRFFYTAKPSSSEKNLMYEEFEEKQTIGGEGLSSAHGSLKAMGKNFHPTVKAQSLMQYLIKLITPPKGIVLDMFAGSGSTLLAAKNMGHPYVGIEIDPEYVKIAESRLKQGVLNF